MCAAGLAGGARASAQDSDAGPRGSGPPLTADGVLAPGNNPLKYLRDPGTSLRLSNETTITRSMLAAHRAPIRRRPDVGARMITRLAYTSSSRAAEVYGLLRGTVDAHRHVWMQIRIPGRPNGRVGWVRAAGLYSLKLVHSQLVVNRRTLRITFYKDGRKLFRAPVGVGKASTPTPRGHFFIDRKEGEVFGPAYGPHVMFTDAFSVLPDWPGGGAIGIHGTSEPGLVPGRPSHGCIRMHNRAVTRLARMVRVRTPLLIL
jgi:hypothetical protein